MLDLSKLSGKTGVIKATSLNSSKSPDNALDDVDVVVDVLVSFNLKLKELVIIRLTLALLGTKCFGHPFPKVLSHVIK